MRTIIAAAMLAAWLGAALLFSAVVAPAAFAVLPTRTLAGSLVGRVLPAVLSVGMLVSVTALPLRPRGPNGSSRVYDVATIVAFVACAVAQLVIGPRIARIQQAIGGPVDALALDDPRRVMFGRLHAASVGALGVAMLAACAALAVLLLSARRDLH